MFRLLPLAGAFSAIFLFALLLIANSLQVASLVILPFSRAGFRKVNRELANAWWGLSVFWTEKIYGIRVVVTGDPLPQKENVIVISNHQQMPDIVAIMTLAIRYGRLGDLKWFVKDILKYAPGVGWGMLFLDCLFLKRNWDQDAARIHALFKKFFDHRIPIWMVSFPEGTRVKPAKLAKSQEFAKKAGLPVLEHVLLPRARGFVASVIGLRGHADAVYDLTIGYPNGVPSLWQLFSSPVREFHIHVRRYPLSSLSSDEKELTKWIYDRFIEKDALMAKFKREKRFD